MEVFGGRDGHSHHTSARRDRVWRRVRRLCERQLRDSQGRPEQRIAPVGRVGAQSEGHTQSGRPQQLQVGRLKAEPHQADMEIIEQFTALGLLIVFLFGITLGAVGGAVHRSRRRALRVPTSDDL
jgi:hypothetical protein